MSTTTDPPTPPASGRQRGTPRLAEVVRVSQLTPGMIRIVFGGDGLAGFSAGEFTDHYVKLQFPPPGAAYDAPFDLERIKATLPADQWPRVRSYTVQEWDAERSELTIDFVVHGDAGVAGPWAARAEPGRRIQFQGPGGAYAPDATAGWHLMVGDASVLPAISASLQRIPAGAPVHVLVELDGPQEQRELDSPGELHVTWVATASGDEPPARPLLDALAALDFPTGRVHCFVHGEASSVRAIRRHLLVDRGLERDGMSVSGYWKRDRTDEGWRAEKAEWNRLVERDAASPG